MGDDDRAAEESRRPPAAKDFLSETEAEALHKAREFRGRLERGETVATARQTVATYFEAWLEGPLRTSVLAGQRAEGTAENYEDVYRSTIAKVLGSIRLDRLNADDVDRMTVTLSKAGYSQNSMRLARTVLGVALKDAVRQGLISAQPGRALHRTYEEAAQRAGLEVCNSYDDAVRVGDDARGNLARADLLPRCRRVPGVWTTF